MVASPPPPKRSTAATRQSEETPYTYQYYTTYTQISEQVSRTLPSVQRTESSPKEPTKNYGIV